MANDNVKPERIETDEKLRTEREKTDEALIESKKNFEKDADLVIEQARENADAVLTEAREIADEKISGLDSHPEQKNSIAKKRAVEDEDLQHQRDLADKDMSRKRQEEIRILRKLLPLEREATDKTLLTERARSDTALENRDDFLGMVCHDLRDLLSGIVLHNELISQYETSTVEGKRIAAAGIQIERYAARMNRLIGDLVDVASIDAGKLSMVPTNCDTSSLIAEAIDTFQSSAKAKNISLEAEGIDVTLFANFDHDRILQVLANLINNAIKFTAPNGKIAISAQDKGAELQFCLQDSGCGIPPEMLESVFERFWQVGKNDRRGLGLGLYISKCIVESHGGKIWVESKPGDGSRFCFTLPIDGQKS